MLQSRAVRIALRVPLFSFGEFVKMELLPPLSPLGDLLKECAMMYLYCEEAGSAVGRSGQINDTNFRAKVRRRRRRRGGGATTTTTTAAAATAGYHLY